ATDKASLSSRIAPRTACSASIFCGGTRPANSSSFIAYYPFAIPAVRASLLRYLHAHCRRYFRMKANLYIGNTKRAYRFIEYNFSSVDFISLLLQVFRDLLVRNRAEQTTAFPSLHLKLQLHTFQFLRRHHSFFLLLLLAAVLRFL